MWYFRDPRAPPSTHQARHGDGRPVGPAHEEPSEDHLVEGSIAATGQEPVQLRDTSLLTHAGDIPKCYSSSS